MDLKFKGKRWFSDKSQKWLETVFNEIDGFISRDKSECAANQVPTVGDSVQTDYSNAIRDLFPFPSEEPGKFEAQVGSSQHNDIDETYFNSNLDIGEKPVDTVDNKSSAELDPVGQSNNRNEEFSDLASDYCIGEADGDLHSGSEVDVFGDSESNGILDEIIIAVEENDSKEGQTDKSSGNNVVKENRTNDKPGKLDAQVRSLEYNDSFETYFKSILSIGEKRLDTQVNKLPVELDLVNLLSDSHEELLDLPNGNCIGEEDGCLSSELEIDFPNDSVPNGVLDEIIISKEEDLIDRKTYVVVEENYMKEDITHRSSDNLVEANDSNDKQFYRMFDIVEDYCPEEASLLSESTQEKIETSPEVPPAGLLCHSQKGRLACNSELDMVTCVNDTPATTMQSPDVEGVSVENKAVNFELTSSRTTLFTEINSILQLPHRDGLHREENNISRPRHELECASRVPSASLICNSHEGNLACSRELNKVDSVAGIPAMPSSEIDLLGIPVENKTVDTGLASSQIAALSTEASRFLELPHEEILNCEENICSKPVHAGRCASELPPQVLVFHSQKDKLPCSGELNIVNDVSDTPALRSSEIDLSRICVENKAVDMGLAYSNSPLSTESCSMQELSRCQEKNRSNRFPAVRCASDLPCSVSSSHASQTSSSDNNFVDSTLSRIIMSMPSSGESCKVDIEDPGMETIELFEDSEKAKFDGSCVIVDSELLHAASFRTLRHKSYKKILQDAFASRKRLKKEYEQLGILYGDIDIETSVEPAKDLLFSTASSSINSEKSFPGSSEPDWELL